MMKATREQVNIVLGMGHGKTKAVFQPRSFALTDNFPVGWYLNLEVKAKPGVVVELGIPATATVEIDTVW